MVKELQLMYMVIQYLKEILLRIKKKALENIIMKMVKITLGNGIMIKNMEKELYIIKMVKLNMKVILLLIILKDMENIMKKMVNITQDNL